MSRVIIFCAAMLLSMQASSASTSLSTALMSLRVAAMRGAVDVDLKTFPFADFIGVAPIQDIARVQDVRNSLDAARLGEGRKFVAALGDYYLNANRVCVDRGPFDQRAAANLLTIGHAIKQRVRVGQSADRDSFMIYAIVADFMFAQVANCISQDIQQNAGSSSVIAAHQAVIDLLKREHVSVQIAESSKNKIVSGLMACVSLQTLRGKVPSDCRYVFGRMFGRVLRTSSGATGLADAGLAPGTLHDFEHLFKVQDRGKKVGSVLFIDYDRVKITYFASEKEKKVGRLDQALATLVQKGDVLAGMTAGFTNRDHEPEGLVAQAGHIVNPVIRPWQDGLVLIQGDGSLTMENLRGERGIDLDGMDRRLRPTSSLLDYIDLNQWIAQRYVTTFQTQLIAWDGVSLVKPRRNESPRERRMLAKVRNAAGREFLVVVDDNRWSTLWSQTNDAMAMFDLRKLKIDWMINVDVGSYNILQIYSTKFKSLQDYAGPVPIQKATNLFVIRSR